MFLEDCNAENEIEIFTQNYDDQPSTNYPNTSIVDNIVSVFAKNNLKGVSNIRIGDKPLTWAEAFTSELQDVVHETDKILDQYADRDDRLISLVDEINNRARGLIHMIRSPLLVPELSHFYDDGVPEVHLNFFRYFFLALLKSHRVIREFLDN